MNIMKCFIGMIFLLLFACKKENYISNKPPCTPQTYNYYLPDSFYHWYTNLVDTGTTLKYYVLKSNTGLTETIEINKASPFNIYRDGDHGTGPTCNTYNYWGYFYSYKSNLFKHYFFINVDFQYEDIDEDRYAYGRAYTDTVNLVIDYVTYNSTTVWNTHVFMVQRLLPNYSNKLKMVYITGDQPTVFEECDTCVQYIGEITQGNRIYKDVTKYISTLTTSISSTVITEFLIDKKFGVIQFKKRDGTTWKIEPK